MKGKILCTGGEEAIEMNIIANTSLFMLINWYQFWKRLVLKSLKILWIHLQAMVSIHFNLMRRDADSHLKTKTLGIATIIIYFQIVKMIILILTSDFWVRGDFRVIVALLIMQMYQFLQIGHVHLILWIQGLLLTKIMVLWIIRHANILNFHKI